MCSDLTVTTWRAGRERRDDLGNHYRVRDTWFYHQLSVSSTRYCIIFWLHQWSWIISKKWTEEASAVSDHKEKAADGACSLRMSVPKCKYCTLRSFCLCAWPISWENGGHSSPSRRLTLTLTKLQVCGTKIQPLTTPKYRWFFFLSLQRWLFGK